MRAASQSRARPIPFYGELGSVNPVVALPAALQANGAALAATLAGSIALGCGQFCTSPGIVLLFDDPSSAGFTDALATALAAQTPHAMLTPGMRRNFDAGVARLRAGQGVQVLLDSGAAAEPPSAAAWGAEARRLEPALSPEVRVAIHSETSGLFDSHAYFLALQGEFEDRGGSLVVDTPVVRGAGTKDGIEIETGGASPSRIKARTVVNSAGHQALPVARSIEGGPIYSGVRMYWVKGSYFVASGRAAFARLIYPMHNSATQGLHLAIDLGGRTRLGPDAEWLPEGAKPPFDYEVDPRRAEHFYREVRRYWPGLKDGALSPDYSGVRPKIVGKGQPSADFMIDAPESHGVTGLVNLIGIESPGLTSSLAIGEMVAELV